MENISKIWKNRKVLREPAAIITCLSAAGVERHSFGSFIRFVRADSWLNTKLLNHERGIIYRIYRND